MFIMRAFGGLLYLSGGVIMTVNVWATILGKLRAEKPMRDAAYDAALDRPILARA
jgi:cytochrome c oxidase cbb3-type subunit 1